jgi:hypothetical protein
MEYSAIGSFAEEMVQIFDIRTPSILTPVGSL